MGHWGCDIEVREIGAEDGRRQQLRSVTFLSHKPVGYDTWSTLKAVELPLLGLDRGLTTSHRGDHDRARYVLDRLYLRRSDVAPAENRYPRHSDARPRHRCFA